MLVARTREDLPMVAIADYLRSSVDAMIITIKKGATSAIEHIREENFNIDLLVTDMELLQGTGTSLTMMVREEEKAYGKKIPIIWTTKFDFDPEDMKHPIARAAKFLDIRCVMKKPVDYIKVIEEFIEERKITC